MTQRIDPILASSQIDSEYRRYLRSLVSAKDRALAEELDREIADTSTLSKGPYLEASPAYTKGASLRDLIGEGVLPQTFDRFDSPALPLDRPLYAHQELATRKARLGRNIVVSTGTGSGKTESFLIPILAAIAEDMEAGRLGSGVRALLLYPMNALANDQMKRLRQVLAVAPEVTFGRYIGDTERERTRAEKKFELLNPGEPRLSNELLSREEMWESPPHFLLTNYAMLEYLLIRPHDMRLFEPADSWRFMVVDEAHVYNGAKGSEIAMLLRRLRERVATEEIQAIATSATVGAESQPQLVTEFAEHLFGLPFAWNARNRDEQDLVRAERIEIPKATWGPLSVEDYLQLVSAHDVATELSLLGAPEFESAHDVLGQESVMAAVRSSLAKGARTVQDLCRHLGSDWTPKSLANVVEVGGKVFDPTGVPLLSARYHLWLRATEGVFACLDPEHPHASVARVEECLQCALPAFEIGACSRCGTAYAIGSEVTEEGNVFLRARLKSFDPPTWMALTVDEGLLDEDDEAFDEDAPETADAVTICIDCACISPQGTSACRSCRRRRMRAARRVESHARTLRGCVACGSRTKGQVRQLDSGADASAAVLATSLYQNLPGDDGPAGDNPGEGRKLLAFSDSRQGAAFFAPYLNSSYRRIFERRLLMMGIEKACDAEGGSARLDDVLSDTVKIATEAGVFERRASRRERERAVALWLAQELVAMDERQSLEGLGMIAMELDESQQITNHPIWSQLGLSPMQGLALVTELLRTIRRNGAVAFNEEVDPGDEAFSPRLGPIYVRDRQTQAKVISWFPTKGSNRRLDYLTRILSRTSSEMSPEEVLSGVWKMLTRTDSQTGPKWLKASSPRGLGVVYQVDQEWLRVRKISEESEIYRCTACGLYAASSVMGVCPTYRCAGSLDPEHVPRGDGDRSHYRRLYRSLVPIPMAVREHTAQWRAAEAADIQNQFIRGEVNTLSCSTTFELGVDVGELQAVLLRNVPPGTANYVQRAGRAGRRTSSAALVVTFAQRRSHDLSFFGEPKRMIDGNVLPPIIPLANERIDRRHAHSVAFAAFFRYAYEQHGLDWSSVGPFLNSPIDQPDQPDPRDRLREFLTPVPKEVTESLRQILPAEVQKEIDLVGGSWVSHLLEHLDNVAAEVKDEVDYFDGARARAAETNKYRLADQFQRVVQTLTKRNLLGFLGSRNILPKYGFPTDVVELRTLASGNAVGQQLDLSRDLSTAIFEYAPGSQIVAGGWLWTSAGVYRLPDRELVHGTFSECRTCHMFESSLEALDPLCPTCGSDRRVQEYAVPEFGFVAEREPAKPGNTPPLRTWNGDTYYVQPGQEEEIPQVRVETNGWNLQLSRRARMMSVSVGITGNGFYICDWCGRGLNPTGKTPNKHTHAWKDAECSGPLKRRCLAHSYETDVLHVDLGRTPNLSDGAFWSLLYAVLEATADVLEIARDDIDGTLTWVGGRPSLVLFDTVPGGAGCVLQIPGRIDDVLARAKARVTSCECGEETSCYSCLRSFRNQRRHDILSRKAALALLETEPDL